MNNLISVSDIVDSFKVVNSTSVKGNEITTKGIDHHGFNCIVVSKYKHEKVASAVHDMVSYFIGVK